MEKTVTVNKLTSHVASAHIVLPEKEKASKKGGGVELKNETESIINETSVETNTSKVKVLFCISEAQPYCATGGLGEVGGSLPKAFGKYCEGDVDIRVMVPLYQVVASEVRKKMKFLGHTNVNIYSQSEYCGVFELREHGIVYYFLDNERFFKRDMLYGFDDDNQRFAFFSKACLDTFGLTGFIPDIIHANDWHTALSVVYLKTIYAEHKVFSKVKSVFTLHNINFQGNCEYSNLLDVFGLDYKYKNVLEYNGQLNLVKGAIDCCDMYNTVSPNYAEEIKTSTFGMGLEECVNRNAHKLSGILNGIDYDFYNPKRDKEIFVNFDEKTLDKKIVNKHGIQKLFHMQVDETIPILLYNGRLTGQKGIDLIKDSIDTILTGRIQMVVMGNGEKRYENFLDYVEGKYQGKFKAVRYSNNLSKKLYAAADLVLMPSYFEPCGLCQMIASRYGAIPIVRETGGLKDSIRDFGCEGGGNGYTFANYNVGDMVYSIKRAVQDFYNDGPEWINKIRTVIKVDFSWKRTVKDYYSLYKKLKKPKVAKKQKA